MARLVFVPIARLNPDCSSCAAHWPGFYRAVWELSTHELDQKQHVDKLKGHFLFGVMVCAN